MRGNNITLKGNAEEIDAPEYLYRRRVRIHATYAVTEWTTLIARGAQVGFSANDGGRLDQSAQPAASSTPSRNWGRLYLIPVIVLVDVLVLGTTGGFLGYLAMALVAYGDKLLEGYDGVEVLLSLPIGWGTSMLSLIAFSAFLKRQKKRRTLSRSLSRSALVSFASAFAVTFVLYLLLFLGAV